jgi:hypothetical protein
VYLQTNVSFIQNWTGQNTHTQRATATEVDVEGYETILAAAKEGRGEVQVSKRFNI